MSGAIQCDRCQKCEEHGVDQAIIGFDACTGVKNGDRELEGLEYDLCKSCARELKRWLDTKPT